MKKNIFTLIFSVIVSMGYAQSVAFCGIDCASVDEFAFVLIRDFSAGEQIYFTEDEYQDNFNNFAISEGHLVWTVPAGGLLKNDVISITESSSNTYTASAGTATHITGSGNWNVGTSDEIYAYSASNASGPWNNVTAIHCFIWTSSAASSDDQNPLNDYPNCIVIDFNIGGGGGFTGNLNVAARTNTTAAMLNDASNWTTSPGGVILDLTDFTSNALPVEFISFNAYIAQGYARLTWQTATEKNNKGFDIERSTDGKSWETIGFVQGNGTTQEVQNYTYTDEAPLAGTNYYRLKQVDFDGKYEYSDIVNVKLEIANNELEIFPNPVSDKLNIINGQGQATIYNVLSQPIQEFLIPNSQFVINTADLPKGQYILRISQQNGNVITRQFMK